MVDAHEHGEETPASIKYGEFIHLSGTISFSESIVFRELVEFHTSDPEMKVREYETDFREGWLGTWCIISSKGRLYGRKWEYYKRQITSAVLMQNRRISRISYEYAPTVKNYIRGEPYAGAINKLSLQSCSLRTFRLADCFFFK